MKFLKSGKLLFYTYIFLFIILNILVAYFINTSIKSDYLESKLDFSSFQIDSINKKLQKEADIYFDEVVNNSQILDILNEIDDRTKWDEIRASLITSLSQPFQRMKKNGVRQFQFHTKDNLSLLRMHHIEQFGDSLKGFRYSVETTNKTLKPHHGFEEGKLKNGFRNVYPIIYKGKHLGSVEISFSFQNLLKNRFRLMVLRTTVQEKVESRFLTYSISTINNNFCFEKKGLNKFLISKNIDSQIKKKLSGQLELGKSFSIYIEASNNKAYIINFVAIKNLENKSTAYFINYFEDSYISEQFYKLILYFILANSLIILAVILFFRYKERVDNYIIHEVLKNNTNLIFTHKDNQILRANQKLLSFFKLSSVKELGNIDFICNSFIQEEGFVVDKDKYCSIIDRIEDEHIYRVQIKNLETGKLHIFSVSVIHIQSQNIFLVVLTDITKVTVIKPQVFDNKIYRDNFTSLYNRYKFNLDLKDKTLKQITFSLVLINIDNLKEINKKYGSMIGDNILLEFSHLINVKIRKGDILYKFDENHFIVVVDDNMMNSTNMAKKLKSIISKNKFAKEVFITASFGITEFRKLESKNSILDRVQSALNLAKASGKNCVITV